DVRRTKRFVSIFTAVWFTNQVNQHQVVFSTSGNDVNAALNKSSRHCLGIFDHLFLISFLLRRHGFFKADGFCCYHVHYRTTLTARENRRVKFLFNLFVGFSQNDTATRTAQGFVGCRGGDVGNLHRVGILSRCNQTSHVRHIDKQVSTNLVSDIAKTLPIHNLGIRRETSNDNFWFVFNRQTLNFFVIDQTSLRIQTVLNSVVVFARRTHLRTVGEVAAVCQTHSQDSVAGSTECSVYSLVSLRAGMSLYVGVVSTKQLLNAFDG